MNKPPCDCLNDCGDDNRIALGAVDPCDYFKNVCRVRQEKQEHAEKMEKYARRYELLRKIAEIPSRKRSGLVVRTSIAHISGEALDALLDSIQENLDG